MNIGKMKFDLVELGVPGSPFSTLGKFICIFLRNILPLLKTFFFKPKPILETVAIVVSNRQCVPFSWKHRLFNSEVYCSSIVLKCFVLSVGIEVGTCEYPTDLNPENCGGPLFPV